MAFSAALPPSTVEDWAECYVSSACLADKIEPPSVPERWRAHPLPVRVLQPGRPLDLVLSERSPRTPRPGALRDPRRRAQLLHTFWHHELQAAELMAWAISAFADAELEFRQGLLRVCLDEIRHMRAYQLHIERLGFRIGDFSVRDWFWERVPRCPTKQSFVALMGMGFEAANLEHAPHFAAQFRQAGDLSGALVQEQVAREESFHVAFAVEWFTRWTGDCRFEEWQRSLPPPLSPLTLRGRVCDRSSRLRAGMPLAFVEALEAWEPEPRRARRTAP